MTKAASHLAARGINVASLQMLQASHNYRLAIEAGNVLVWDFDNIQLPDSVHDEPGSHGLVRYRIRMRKDLTLGDEVHNRAAIYFDFNPAVSTNTVVNRVWQPSGVGSAAAGTGLDFQCRTLPESRRLLITGVTQAGAATVLVSCTDMNGCLIWKRKIGTLDGQFRVEADLSASPCGAYIFRITDGKSVAVRKVALK